MAKHTVICKYCKKSFDANAEEYVKPVTNRYAHKACHEAYLKQLEEDKQKKEKQKTQEQKDKEDLENYIKQLFNIPKITVKIKKQIDKFHSEYQYSYSGIKLSLTYFFEVQHNDLSKANDGIGIVPYIYLEAKRYYYELWLAQQKNKDKSLEEYKPKEIEICIPPPQVKPRRKKIFLFLDKEE